MSTGARLSSKISSRGFVCMVCGKYCIMPERKINLSIPKLDPEIKIDCDCVLYPREVNELFGNPDISILHMQCKEHPFVNMMPVKPEYAKSLGTLLEKGYYINIAPSSSTPSEVFGSRPVFVLYQNGDALVNFKNWRKALTPKERKVFRLMNPKSETSGIIVIESNDIESNLERMANDLPDIPVDERETDSLLAAIKKKMEDIERKEATRCELNDSNI